MGDTEPSAKEADDGLSNSINDVTTPNESIVSSSVKMDEKEMQKLLPPGLRTYKRVELPTAEQIMQEDFMNNCAVRTVLSGVMGSALGVVFGVFMGTMDSSVSGIKIGCNKAQGKHLHAFRMSYWKEMDLIA